MKRFLALIALGFGVGWLLGCNSFERTTFQTLAATQAALNSAQADYEAGCPATITAATPACIPHNQAAYTTITKAKAADALAVNAMVVYEQEKATGTTASLDTQETVVASELAQLPALLADIKTLYQGGK